MVSTLDSESSDPSSNLGGTFLFNSDGGGLFNPLNGTCLPAPAPHSVLLLGLDSLPRPQGSSAGHAFPPGRSLRLPSCWAPRSRVPRAVPPTLEGIVVLEPGFSLSSAVHAYLAGRGPYGARGPGRLFPSPALAAWVPPPRGASHRAWAPPRRVTLGPGG